MSDTCVIGCRDENDIVGEILLLRDVRDTAILIVEGTTDEVFYANFVDEETADIVIAFGKENALRAMEILRQHFAGILCVVDQDFDQFLGIDNRRDDVVVGPDHDLEMYIVGSGVVGG